MTWLQAAVRVGATVGLLAVVAERAHWSVFLLLALGALNTELTALLFNDVRKRLEILEGKR